MVNRTYTIYLITCIVTGKKYVGQTHRGLAIRWASHVNESVMNRGRLLAKAIHKYGSSSFTQKVLETCDNLDSANEAEIKWIAKLQTMSPFGYNLDAGGNVRNCNSETRQLLSVNARKQFAEMTPEQRNDFARKGTNAARKVNVLRTPEQCKEIARKTYAALTPEKLSERSKKSIATFNSRYTPEARSEILRKRWQALTPSQRSEIAIKRQAARTPEQRSASVRKAWASIPVERRKEIARNRWASKTPEKRKEIGRKFNASLSSAQRAEIMRKVTANMTPEQRKERARRASVSRWGKKSVMDL